MLSSKGSGHKAAPIGSKTWSTPGEVPNWRTKADSCHRRMGLRDPGAPSSTVSCCASRHPLSSGGQSEANQGTSWYARVSGELTNSPFTVSTCRLFSAVAVKPERRPSTSRSGRRPRRDRLP
jgi:hypothetical protein